MTRSFTTSIRLLFVSARPHGSDHIRFQEEHERIRRLLPPPFEVISVRAASIRELREAFIEYRPHLFHFAGHGSEEGALLLEDKAGYIELLLPGTLGGLFQTLQAHYSAPYAVLLNACHSLPAAQALAPHIPLVIGMAGGLGDDEALEFADAFYHALPRGTVQGACEMARYALPISEQILPHLLARENTPLAPWLTGDSIESIRQQLAPPAEPDIGEGEYITSYDNDVLEGYFTDVEHLRAAFAAAVATEALPKRIFALHGVGGVGKSSLLRMFRLHCKRQGVPVALTSGDEAKSVVEVLEAWAGDLKQAKVRLPTFEKSLQHYQVIRAQVEEQARKAQGVDGAGLANLSKVVTKPAVGMAMGRALGAGLLLSTQGGASAEALIDWLRSFLGKPDIDLLLDPDKALTRDFLEDIAKVAPKRRLVLLLDTFEQMTTLEEWVRTLAYHLHPQVLLVIAGRAVPNWGRQWPGWMAEAHIEELRPMGTEVMRELVRRYHAMIRGGEPDPTQVEGILAFARGLPIVVTSAVQLWVQYGVEDFLAIKPQVVANLVDRLMEGVPAEMIPMLEAAAVVRWFNQEILRAVTGREDVDAIYSELRRFPFVRSRAEGFALHDAVREVIDESMTMQDPEKHRVLHERAAAYFEGQLEGKLGWDSQRLRLEVLYHHVQGNENEGVRLLQKWAEELADYQMVDGLRILLNDANHYALRIENNRLWLEYYQARLMYLEARFKEAETKYKMIHQHKNAESRLRGYALSEWGSIAKKGKFLHQSEGLKALLGIIEESNSLLEGTDPKRALNLINLGGAYYRLGNSIQALECFENALQFFEEREDGYGIASVYNPMKDVYVEQGNWKRVFEIQQEGLKALPPDAKFSMTYAELVGAWAVAWAWAGRYKESEDLAKVWLAALKDSGGYETFYPLEYLIYSSGVQGKYQEAEHYFIEASQAHHSLFGEESSRACVYWAASLLNQGVWPQAKQYFQIGYNLKLQGNEVTSIPIVLRSLGLVSELCEDLHQAAFYYQENLVYKLAQQYYFECGALSGLVRVKHAQGDLDAIPALLSEAEALAQQYEYNDHLASLRLTQGHLAADPDTTLRYYQQTLVYALRYNRFLLDEVLSGRPQGTPLRPIIPTCLELGEEGERLLRTLRDWWQTGLNDIGTPRPDTISPIPEGISLLEGERLARQREPGDGSPQRSVLAQLDAALGQ